MTVYHHGQRRQIRPARRIVLPDGITFRVIYNEETDKTTLAFNVAAANMAMLSLRNFVDGSTAELEVDPVEGQNKKLPMIRDRDYVVLPARALTPEQQEEYFKTPLCKGEG